MEPILKVSGLTKTFSRQGQADFTAVKNISFDLFPGECLAIIGESGSGKTTAVNMIARLVDVTSGSVFLDGEDITNRKGKALREVYRAMQMVFQTPADSFDPRRTLGDGIGESDVRVNFGGVTFFSGDHLYADNTGIILSEDPLDIE